MEILLDTNFIINCAKNKIDYEAIVNGLTSEEVKWIVPLEVLGELRGLRMNRDKRKGNLDSIDLGIEILSKINAKFPKISDTHSDVDTKIVNYIKNTPIILATMDKGLKGRVNNKILTIRGKKRLEII